MGSDWETVLLGEIASKRTDFIPVLPNAEYHVVGVQRSGWGLVHREPIRGDSMKFQKLMRLEQNDLVYRTITAFEAPSAVVGPDFEGTYVTPQTFPVFKLDCNRILPAFMDLITTYPIFHEAMADRCTGTVLRRKTLSVSAFLNIPIRLPSLEEQRRIVDVMDACSSALTNVEEELQAAEGLLASVRHDKIGRPEKNATFGKVATLQRGYDLPTDQRVPGDVPVIASSGQVGTHTAAMVSGPGVLTGRSGTIGIVQLLQTDFWPLNTTLFVKDFKGNRPKYIRYLMQTMDLKVHAGGSTVPSLNRNVLEHVPVYVPEIPEQDDVVELLEALEHVVESAQETAKTLKALKAELCSALLSGEHKIPERYDELVGA